MCGNLEDYVGVTAKVQKSQSKDYEKVLKVGLSGCYVLDYETGANVTIDRERSPERGAPFLAERWRRFFYV